MNFYVFGLINFIIKAGFELVKQNRLTKNSERSEEIGPTQAKKILDLRIILWKMERVLTNLFGLLCTMNLCEITLLFTRRYIIGLKQLTI